MVSRRSAGKKDGKKDVDVIIERQYERWLWNEDGFERGCGLRLSDRLVFLFRCHVPHPPIF